MFPNISEIKKRRKKLELTQTQLAVHANVSQSMIAKIESNMIEPSYAIVCEIFEALNILENKNTIKAKNIMKKRTASLSPESLVTKSIKIMRKKEISQIPIIQNDIAIGSISEKTILEKIIEDPHESKNMTVSEIMDAPFPTIDEETPIDMILAILKHNQAILVLKKNKISGIITKADILSTI
ncbi:MAG: CBS domain-containing protein [Candidatus Aenigmarchaeota archaeon]|nr:CBS domain-containing protein [Candidatus Aenigmarchaeota archaeon]